MTTRSRTCSAAALAVTTLSLIAGCYGGPTAADGDPAAEQVGIIVNPQISMLGISEKALSVRPERVRVVSGWQEAEDDGEGEPIPGAVLVGAFPTDLRYQFPVGARLPLTVRTNRGEAEALSLRGPGELCSDRPDMVCHAFLLVLASVDDAYRLLPELESISARLTQIILGDSSVTATVFVLDGDFEEAMRTAQRWPGVRAVKLPVVFYLAHVGGQQRGFAGGLPVEFGAPVPADGRFQFEAGDTITVEYRQPDGNALTTSVTP